MPCTPFEKMVLVDCVPMIYIHLDQVQMEMIRTMSNKITRLFTRLASFGAEDEASYSILAQPLSTEPFAVGLASCHAHNPCKRTPLCGLTVRIPC